MTAMILVTSVVWSIEFLYRVFCRQLAIVKKLQNATE